MSSEMLSRTRFFLQVASGLSALATLYILIEGLGWVPGNFFIMALILGTLTPILNLIWAWGCLAITIFGAHKGMPGVAWSPVIFGLLWCSISIVQRAYLTIPDHPVTDLRSRIASVPKDLRDQTVTLLGIKESSYWYTKALAARQIAAVVRGNPQQLDAQNTYLWKTTYAQGEMCRKKGVNLDWGENRELQAVGRANECFIQDIESRVPNGVIIRGRGSYDAGFTTDVLVRENGRDRTVAEFSTSGNQILSYLPSIGWGRYPSTGIWSFTFTGPTQWVIVARGPSVEHQLAVALFGEHVYTRW